MDLRNIKLGLNTLAQDGEIRKVRIEPCYRFKDGKQTKEVDDNSRVVIMLPEANCDTLGIKVPTVNISEDVKESLPLTPLKFEGFEAKFWTNASGKTMLVAKAASVDIDDTVDF